MGERRLRDPKRRRSRAGKKEKVEVATRGEVRRQEEERGVKGRSLKREMERIRSKREKLVVLRYCRDQVGD